MHQHLVAAQVWRHHHGLPAPVLAKHLANADPVIRLAAAEQAAFAGVRIDSKQSNAGGLDTQSAQRPHPRLHRLHHQFRG